MTKYAGEDLRIWASAKDWDKQPMGPEDLVAVKLTLWDVGAEVDTETPLLDDVDMGWDADEEIWTYFFEFPAAGSYRAKHVFVGLDGKESIEWRRYRVRRQPLS